MPVDAEECPSCLVEELTSYAHESKKIEYGDEHTLIDQVANKLDNWINRHRIRGNPKKVNKKMPEDIIKSIIDKATFKDGLDVALAVGGAGASASIVEVIRSWLPEQTADMKDETVAALASFALFYWGDKLHERLVPVGFGALLSSVGAMTSEATKSLFDMLKKKEEGTNEEG